MLRNKFIYLIFLCPLICFGQSTIALDNVENTWFGWKGTPKVGTYSNIFNGNSNITDLPSSSPMYSSSSRSIGIVGAGLGSSAIEKDTFTFQNITGLNLGCSYSIKFKVASFGINPTTNAAAGVDGSDYIQVSYSTNGGISFIQEIKLTGVSNAMWGFSNLNTLVKTSNNLLTTYPTTLGSEYSTIQLNLPPNISQAALNIIMVCNATGETWQIDDIQLIETCPLPLELGYVNLTKTSDNFKLSWQTLTEDNVDYFSIYLIDPNNNYKKIGEVDAVGFSRLPVEYSFIEKQPFGLNYILLREIDYDGYIRDLKILSIKNDKSQTNLDNNFLFWKHNIIGQEIR